MNKEYQRIQRMTEIAKRMCARCGYQDYQNDISVDSCRLMSTHADSQGRWDETSNRYAMLRYAAFLEAEHRTVLLSLLRAMRCLGGTK